MTIAKEIDLVSELEKAKANVAMLENILAIEKQKDEQQILMSKNQAAVESLSTNVQAVKTELDNLKADLTKNERSTEPRLKSGEQRITRFNALCLMPTWLPMTLTRIKRIWKELHNLQRRMLPCSGRS
jgi:chromosome segregation ATPase